MLHLLIGVAGLGAGFATPAVTTEPGEATNADERRGAVSEAGSASASVRARSRRAAGVSA